MHKSIVVSPSDTASIMRLGASGILARGFMVKGFAQSRMEGGYSRERVEADSYWLVGLGERPSCRSGLVSVPWLPCIIAHSVAFPLLRLWAAKLLFCPSS